MTFAKKGIQNGDRSYEKKNCVKKKCKTYAALKNQQSNIADMCILRAERWIWTTRNLVLRIVIVAEVIMRSK